MRVRVLLQITGDDGTAGGAIEVAVFEKRTERPEDLGLSITDGKVLMAEVQQRVVNAQVTSWAERHRCCEACGARRRSKGSHPSFSSRCMAMCRSLAHDCIAVRARTRTVR